MRAVLVVVVALGMVSAAHTAPSGFREATMLEPAASSVAGKPVRVYCASTTATWESFLQATGGGVADGSSVPGGRETRLSAAACSYLRVAAVAVLPTSTGLAASVLVLTHEAIHLRGETSEGVTDCAAVHEMPRVAVRYFHVAAGKRLRALMAAAWRYRATEGAAYRTVC